MNNRFWLCPTPSIRSDHCFFSITINYSPRDLRALDQLIPGTPHITSCPIPVRIKWWLHWYGASFIVVFFCRDQGLYPIALYSHSWPHHRPITNPLSDCLRQWDHGLGISPTTAEITTWKENRLPGQIDFFLSFFIEKSRNRIYTIRHSSARAKRLHHQQPSSHPQDAELGEAINLDRCTFTSVCDCISTSSVPLLSIYALYTRDVA